MMDKYIKLNLKMISGEIGAALVMALASLLCLANIFMAVIIIMIPTIALLVIIRACKKLFWDGIYGKSAYLYNSLPVNTEEMVAGKLFAAWVMLLAYNAAAFCTVLILLFAGDGMLSMMTDVMSGSRTTLIGVIAGQIDIDMMQFVLPENCYKFSRWSCDNIFRNGFCQFSNRQEQQSRQSHSSYNTMHSAFRSADRRNRYDSCPTWN